MKKIFLFVLIFSILFVGLANAGMLVLAVASGGGGGGCNDTLKDSATDGTGNNAIATASWNIRASSSFTTTSAYDVCEIHVNLYKNNSPTMNLNLSIYSDNGSGLPDETDLLATSDTTIDSSTLPTDSSGDYSEFVFDTPYSLANATTYHIVITSDDYDSTDYVMWASDRLQTGQQTAVATATGAFGNGDSSAQGQFKTYD